MALRGDVRIRFFLFDAKDVVPVEPPPNYMSAAATAVTRRRGQLGPGSQSLKYGNVEGRMCFYIAFHTAFVEDGTTTFLKHQIDEIYNYSDKKYGSDFRIDLEIETAVKGFGRTASSAESVNQVVRHRSDKLSKCEALNARMSQVFGAHQFAASAQVQPSLRYVKMISR